MFDSVKVQVMLQTSMMLHNLPNYNSFIYNEDFKDVQNLHGKYWETDEVQITNYLTSSDIKVGVKQQFRGIYNEPKCEQIRKKIKSVCDYDDIAMVWPIDQVNEDNIPCRLIKLTGVFPKLYGSIMIQNDFKYREHFNRMYLRMQTAGIVKRSHDRYKNKQLKKDYGAQEYYQVELEGVLFEHVKLIFLVYSLMFPLVLLVLAIEIVCSWKVSKISSKVEPIIESENPSVYDLEIVEHSLSDNIDIVSTSTDFKMDELLEVLDLEFME
ncbi:unnamed protein product [Diamesa hyperborea]